MPLQPGEMIGPYRIEGQMGSGGMATVYRAYHPKLDRYVAIKMMHEALLQDMTFQQRFEREARIVARLEHPNIVPVYDFSDHENVPYLVMKHLDGQTLKAVLRDRALGLDEIRRLIRTVADALSYAHDRGVLHRDIKPSNIIIDERGTPYLTDFGLARLVVSGESTMSADMLLGTPFYISPEQAAGSQQVDARADVYSLGVVLYELMVGRVPFQSDTPYATIHDHIYKTPPPPRELNPEITPAVEAVLLKALAKKPEDRYPSALALAQAFEAALNTDGLDHLDPNRQSYASQRAQAAPPPAPPVVQAAPAAPIPPKVQRADEDSILGEVDRELSNIGRQIESAFKRNDNSRMNWRPGTVWRTDGPEGMGFYSQSELDAVEAALPDEERIRKFIEKRNEERTGFIIHAIVFTFMNIMFMTGFFSDPLAIFDGFPWQLFVLFGWGIGLFSHFSEYYNKYGAGRERREEMIQREIERERARRYGTSTAKLKNDELFYDEDEDRARRIRLNEDGELSDSYIEELDAEEKRKRG